MEIDEIASTQDVKDVNDDDSLTLKFSRSISNDEVDKRSSLARSDAATPKKKERESKIAGGALSFIIIIIIFNII